MIGKEVEAPTLVGRGRRLVFCDLGSVYILLDMIMEGSHLSSHHHIYHLPPLALSSPPHRSQQKEGPYTAYGHLLTIP